MERQELVEYLRDVFILEHQLYTYQEIEKKYQYVIERYGKPEERLIVKKHSCHGQAARFSKIEIASACLDGKEIETTEFYHSPECQKIVREINRAKVIRCLKGCILGVLVVSIGVLLMVKGANGIQYGKFLLFGLGLMAVLIGIMIICGGINTSWVKVALYKEVDDYYYKRFKELLEEKIKSELVIKSKAESELCELVRPHMKKTEEMLSKVYSKNIIFPKYRNFVAVGQIYEYFLSGRCSELEGTYGAYNLFEDELRRNIVISQLEQITTRIDGLTNIMHSVCEAISETKKILRSISPGLCSASANTGLEAYNSQCIANNTYYESEY